jgi:hypothetical protein
LWLQIAEGLEEDMSLPDTVRAQLNDLFMNARKEHEEIATTLKEKICVLNAEPHEEHVACALKKAVAELFMEEQKKVSVLYVVETEEESGKYLIKTRIIESRLLQVNLRFSLIYKGKYNLQMYQSSLLSQKITSSGQITS